MVQQQQAILLQLKENMGDLSKLNSSIQTLSGNVDKLIAASGASDQAAIDSAQAAVDSVNSKVVAALPPGA